MRQPRCLWVAPLLMCLPLIAVHSVSAAPRDLTFEQHVEAQRAIAQVYYRHQKGATLPFDQAVTRSLLEAKVRAYLGATSAVTADRLAAEAERVARGSRMPERLREISAALGGDQDLYLEAFIRPLLAAPLARATAGAMSVTCDPAGLWDNGILDDPPLPRTNPSAVWTGSEMIVWGGRSDELPGERYDPVTDTWTVMSTVNAPSPRSGHTAVWTGSRMIIWGGRDGSAYLNLNTGGIYDPASDTWTSTSIMNAPAPRNGHAGFWIGSEMLIWGGDYYEITGGLYNPITNTWRSTTTTGVPARRSYSAVWTGSRMVVWGGNNTNGGDMNTGVLYDPGTDSWTPMTQVNAPAARRSASAVWTGSEMLIWGGEDVFGSPVPIGGRYNPATDAWAGMSAQGEPSSRTGSTAVWSGSRMIVWGGTENYNVPLNTGALYDPGTNTWSTMSTVDAPSGRTGHTAVWTGSTMIVSGGSGNSVTGGRYNPDTNSWLPMGRPAGVGARAGVWTGSEVLIWDGKDGARYSPATDSWTPISGVDSPSIRTGHVAVWSGTEMIVWGGYDSSGYPALATGGRYNPLADRWATMSVTGVPPPRGRPSAVWTGSEMIVWGGWDPAAYFPVDTGGRYDPVADSWAPTSMSGAPTPRVAHTAVWTGSEMIVWGGADLTSHDPDDSWDEGEVNTGGRYDPATDTWRPTPLTGAPSARRLHTAVWTGAEMVVFGGEQGGYFGPYVFNDGGRFNPSTGSWSPISTAGSPWNYFHHGAVWTGSAMVVIGSDWSRESARYDSATDTWHEIAATGRPPFWAGYVLNYGSVVLWTGEMVIVWNGYSSPGGRYFPGASLADDDADGVRVCDGDCDDGNEAVWATPGEVPLLQLQPSGSGVQTQVSWNPPGSPGGVTAMYDTIRSRQPTQLGDVGVADCLESNDGSDTMASDNDVPLPGGIFFYLVRAENACPAGQGSLGTTSSGGHRSARSCP